MVLQLKPGCSWSFFAAARMAAFTPASAGESCGATTAGAGPAARAAAEDDAAVDGAAADAGDTAKALYSTFLNFSFMGGPT